MKKGKLIHAPSIMKMRKFKCGDWIISKAKDNYPWRRLDKIRLFLGYEDEYSAISYSPITGHSSIIWGYDEWEKHKPKKKKSVN